MTTIYNLLMLFYFMMAFIFVSTYFSLNRNPSKSFEVTKFILMLELVLFLGSLFLLLLATNNVTYYIVFHDV